MNLKRLYRTISTPEFARRTKRNINSVRRWANVNGLRKSPECRSKIMSANAGLRWSRRVICAVDDNGLSHAVAMEFGVNNLLMRCGVRFKPIATRQKDFPACSKCLAALASLRDKHVAPPVETSTLRKRRVQKHLLTK